MYLGTIEATEPVRTDRYRPGLGTFSCLIGHRPVTKHQYRCEACGRETAFACDPVSEPFFCRCGSLVSTLPVEVRR